MSAIDQVLTGYGWQTGDLEHARAELAQLRADLKAAQERIAELTQDDRYCPLCTWRGPVELVNGVCPQCDVDWPKACREHRDALTVAQERIAEMAQQINAARNAIRYLRPWRAKDIAADYASLVGGECGYTQSLSDYAKAADAWLAANPAPETEPQPDDERIDRMLSADKFYNDEIAEV